MTSEANKQTAQAFYDLMFNQCQPREAIERFAGADYIQHNPVVPDGKDRFIAYFERMATEYPGKRVHIVRALAEADYVVLHTRQEWPGDSDWAGNGHLPLRSWIDCRALGRSPASASRIGARQLDVLRLRRSTIQCASHADF
jgi:predicted SnoaL-like aldol condensation-catalyzing enzyme